MENARAALQNPDSYTLKDVGIRTKLEVTQSNDKGITGEDIQKAIDKATFSASYESTATHEAKHHLARVLSRGYYYYLALRKRLGLTKESLHITRSRGGYDLASCLQLINPGGVVWVSEGQYDVPASLAMSNVPIRLEGSHGLGDLFFPDDSVYHGCAVKCPTILVDSSVGGVDMLKLGFKTVSGVNRMTFGMHVRDLAFSAYVDKPSSYLSTKTGAAIAIQNVNCCVINRVNVFWKDFGIYAQTANGATPFNRNDILIMKDILLSYNKRGIETTGGTEEVRASNIFSYYSQYEALKLAVFYDLMLSDFFSNADGLVSTTYDQAACRVESIYGSSFLDRIYINSAAGASKGITGVYLKTSVAAHCARSKIFASGVLVQGISGNAIEIDGGNASSVFLRDVYLGSPDGWSEMDGAGSGDILGALINNRNANLKVTVDTGYVRSTLASKAAWFVNVQEIRNLDNFSIYDDPVPVTTQDHMKLLYNKYFVWKLQGGANALVLTVDDLDHTQLLMNDGTIADPMNYVDATLSGTAKIVEIYIDTVPYYFKVYPTKT
jgi:hypothetical protein